MENKRNIQVLLVDDEERFLATAAALFRKRNFDVKTAGSGAEAIEEIKRNNFDVVILDVKMPDMDGNEALHNIKKIKPELAIIMLTGHGSPDSALAGLREGAFTYLTKPCDLDLLTLKIREAFLKKQGLSGMDRRVRDIMLPLSSFGAVRNEWSVAEAIEVILGHKSIVTATVEEEPIEVVIGNRTVITTTVDEGVHRSALVRDKTNKIIGIISFTDFLQGLESTYMRLLTDRPTVVNEKEGDTRTYSGIFAKMVRDLGKKSIGELMLDKPPTIGADSSLLEATNRLLALNVRRLLVMEEEKIIGVIREKDIMLEMARIIR